MNNLFFKNHAIYIPVFLFFFLTVSASSEAQSYKWVKGGGSITSFSSGLDRSERVKQMCTDDNGNVYLTANMGLTNILADTFYRIAAHNYLSGNLHIFVASYTCNGTMRWAKMIEGYGESEVGGIEYYNGHIYISGKSPSDFFNYKYFGEDTIITSRNYGSYLAKLDTGNNGDLKWIRFIGADILGNQSLSNAGTVAVDGQGYIHNFARIERACSVTPTYVTTQPGTYDLKYDVSGTLLSVSQVPALDSVWLASKVIFNKTTGKWFAAIEPNNNYWYSVYTNWNTAVCAFRPDNALEWIDTTGMYGSISSIDYKGGRDLYVCGGGQLVGGIGSHNVGGITATSTIGSKHCTLFKIDTNDNGIWLYNLEGMGGVNSFTSVTILPSSKLALTGLFTGTDVKGADTLTSSAGEVQNPLFVVVDTGGHTIKLDQLHGTGFYDWGMSITSDKIGNAYIGGLMQNNIWGGSLTPYVSNGGNSDYFVMKYGYDCSCLSVPPPAASYTHTVTTTGAYTVAFTYTGSTGYDSVRWNFGDGGTSTSPTPSHTYTGPGTYTACVTVYTSCGSNIYCNTINFSGSVQPLSAGNIRVYPNPARDELVIDGISNTAYYRLMSITGAMTRQGNIENSNAISLKDCVPGIYLLDILQSDGTKNVVRVVKE